MLLCDRYDFQILLLKRDIDVLNMPQYYNDFKVMKILSYV
jgi:hypothetical protein